MSGLNLLTDRGVSSLVPGLKRLKVRDGGSLFLVVESNGTKKWQYLFKFNHKQQTLSLGTYPTVSLAEARRCREAAKQMLADGKNPCAVKRERKRQSGLEQEPPAKQPTFQEVAQRWYDKQFSRWSQKHQIEVWKSLKVDVFPRIGAREMDTIRSPEILGEIIEPLEKQGKIEKASRVLQRMRLVFNYARAAGIMTAANPCADLRGAMRAKPRIKPRPALLELEPLREMIKTLEASPCHVVTRLANRFIALTAARPGNVNRAEWSEIEGDCWVIPAHKMKARRPFLVPLSRQALEVLQALRPLTGGGRYLFPNGRSTLSPMSENALTYYLNRSGYQHLHCAHGWRSSFSSIMNLRHPTERHIIDFALAHSPKDRVEAAYNRANYLDRRREHLQEWADLILEGQMPLSELVKLRAR